MAEKVAGTEKAFVELMNKKAKELGLTNTNFVNCTGLDEKGHYSSAYDISVIARELMKHKDVFKYTTNYEDYLRKNSENKFWLVNTNKLLKTYTGVDGLKTGMTDDAGYCMTVTAIRNNMRLLAIVLGEKEGKVRNKEVSSLLDYGFNLYEVTTIKKKGDIVGETYLDKADTEKINIVVNEDVTILKKTSDIEKEYNSEIKMNDITLPLKKGDSIGKLLIKDGSEVIKSVDIVSDRDINKTSFINLFWNMLKGIITGDII